jgi:hypothetical protein
MPTKNAASNITAPAQFLEVGKESYAYRRLGAGSGLPLLCLQHFTGTTTNWDPAVTEMAREIRKATPAQPRRSHIASLLTKSESNPEPMSRIEAFTTYGQSPRNVTVGTYQIQ